MSEREREAIYQAALAQLKAERDACLCLTHVYCPQHQTAAPLTLRLFRSVNG